MNGWLLNKALHGHNGAGNIPDNIIVSKGRSVANVGKEITTKRVLVVCPKMTRASQLCGAESTQGGLSCLSASGAMLR